MSTNTLFRAGLLATIGVAALSMTANAQSNSRYGNVHDYESSQNCGNPCVAAPAANSRYGSDAVVQQPMMQQQPVYQAAPVYVDCRQTGTCAPAAPVYAEPTYQAAPTYSTQSYASSSYGEPVNCPAGTTAQADGTCMQGSSYGSTTSTESYSTYSAPTTMMAPVNCPAGTTAQPDGTCMQGSDYSSSSSYSSGSSYSSSNSYASTTMSEPVNCPAGTTAQSDGTCMQGGSSSSAYTGSTVELYTGDASTTTDTTYGYTSDGAYGPKDYLPIRK
ncbi:hypothetical protein ACJ3XI_00165 [Litorimonas sp. RW-G-Af-16]|uniref:hypothetical protein n=1 Tax=Litorimonas sp. RW-G-Af-16 TaxID=3241168 RepID=UPI00390C4C49